MDILVTDKFLNLLMIASTFSVVLMALVQKIKTLTFIKTNNHIMLINFLFSFLGIIFGMTFYNLDIFEGLWVSFFTFIGAPAIYQLLKSQNIIKYTPKTLDECRGYITIPKENVINREDEVD